MVNPNPNGLSDNAGKELESIFKAVGGPEPLVGDSDLQPSSPPPVVESYTLEGESDNKPGE